MRVYAKSSHVYHDTGNKREYRIPGGTWIEMPDGVGRYIVDEHPTKLFILQPGQNKPDDPVAKQEIVNTEMVAPVDREMKPAFWKKQRR